MLRVNNNGGWCWFQSERAVVHKDCLYVGSVANKAGPGAEQRHGNIEVTCVDLVTGVTKVWVLHERLEGDDHDSPALYVRPNGEIVAVYGQHGDGLRPGDSLQRWRTFRPSAHCWTDEQTLDVGANYTYANLYFLPDENLLYNFHRGFGFNPNYCSSADHGATWKYGGRALMWQADEAASQLPGAGRPYARYCSNGTDAIHVVVTEDHPRNYDNSIYHGYFKNKLIHRTDGTIVGQLSQDSSAVVKPTDLTLVFKGSADSVAWTTDIRLDAQGHARVLFTVQIGDGDKKAHSHKGGADLRFMYGMWDGSTWVVGQAGHAGSCLYAPEVDYTGLGVLHPYVPSLCMYVSTNAYPDTGAPIYALDGASHRVYEIFKGASSDKGRTWQWTRLTFSSAEHGDNLRPVIAPGNPQRLVLLWLRGKLRSFTDYQLEVVALSL